MADAGVHVTSLAASYPALQPVVDALGVRVRVRPMLIPARYCRCLKPAAHMPDTVISS